jgi:hypothetical protein
MGLGLWNIPFLNANAQRSYPLADWGTKRDATNTIQLPDSFLVGLVLPVHAGLEVEPDKFFLKTLGIFPTGYTLGIGYNDNTANPPLVAVANIARATHRENRSYAVAGVDDFDDTVGHLAIGRLDEIDRLPPGVYTFAPAGAPLEPDTIRPDIRGVSAIVVVNGQDRTPRLYGDIELIAGDNMRITASQISGQTPRIVFSAISGEGLNETCACEEESEGPPIRFINGIPPLPDGNFRLVGDECVNIQPIANGLQFRDECSQPCCDCQEIAALEEQVERLGDGALTLRAFVNKLGAEVTSMTQGLLGSALGDGGCIEC